MCLSWSNSPFPMYLCECKADRYWHLFCKNQSETHFVLGLYSSSSSSKSLTRAWNGINGGRKLYIYFSGFGWPHADCLLSDLQGNCQSELVPIVIYCVGLRWQFFCLTRKLGFDIYRAVPIQVIHKPKFALLLPGKPTQEKWIQLRYQTYQAGPFETHEKVRFSSWNQPSKSFVLEECPSAPSM